MLYMLKNFKVVLWDFDGVLMQSNAVRDQGFLKVLEAYPPEQVAQLMVYHQANGGLSRYVKFRYFFEVIRQEAVSDEQIQSLAEAFSVIMKSLLVNPDLLIADAWNLVKKLHQQQVPMHIVSGSDQTELRYLCAALQLDAYFVSIHGSPTPKKQWVHELLLHNQYPLHETILIGDSINDYDAAIENGIRFGGYNNPALIGKDIYFEHLSTCNS